MSIKVPKPPPATTAGRSRNMAAIRRRDTGPERAIRSRLHATGHRYRVELRLDLPGGRVRPDLIFTRAKVAVFVDGCFWHCCPEHGKPPEKNGHYWGPKLARNVERDRIADRTLQDAGWFVLRVWEHEDPGDAVSRIETVVKQRRANLQGGAKLRETIRQRRNAASEN